MEALAAEEVPCFLEVCLRRTGLDRVCRVRDVVAAREALEALPVRVPRLALAVFAAGEEAEEGGGVGEAAVPRLPRRRLRAVVLPPPPLPPPLPLPLPPLPLPLTRCAGAGLGGRAARGIPAVAVAVPASAPPPPRMEWDTLGLWRRDEDVELERLPTARLGTLDERRCVRDVLVLLLLLLLLLAAAEPTGFEERWPPPLRLPFAAVSRLPPPLVTAGAARVVVVVVAAGTGGGGGGIAWSREGCRRCCRPAVPRT